MGDDVGDGGFAGAGWSPQYHGWNAALLNSRTQDTSFTGQVLLARQFI